MKNKLLAAVLCGAGGVLAAPASLASTTFGTLGNFDVFNDSTAPYYGFEIELEGISPGAIAGNGSGSYYTYNNWHYGAGMVSSNGTSTIVRYFDGGAHSTAPYLTAITPTNGHTCITVNGCEHFGLGINANPTATRYYWLDAAGNRAAQVTLVGAPTVNVYQPPAPAPGAPAPAPQVQFVLEAPEAPEAEVNDKFSDAVWVKVMKTELDLEHMAELDDLMAGNDAKIADAGDPNAVEVEWKLMQRRLGLAPDDPDNALNKLDSGEQEAGADAEQVLRTYQFYAFAGTYNEEHEAVCVDTGTCEDDVAVGNQDQAANIERYVGRLIGQQMVAANLGGPVVLPAQVPVPGAVWLFGSALLGFAGLSRRKPV